MTKYELVEFVAERYSLSLQEAQSVVEKLAKGERVKIISDKRSLFIDYAKYTIKRSGRTYVRRTTGNVFRGGKVRRVRGNAAYGARKFRVVVNKKKGTGDGGPRRK